jgi:uncharacterized OB-fold protein
MAEYLKPLPTADVETKPYWEGCKRHELLLPWCSHCKDYFFPAQAICPHCLKADIQWHKSSGKGVVYSMSVVHQNKSAGFRDQGPYVLAYVTLDEGVQMLSNVLAADPYSVKVGTPVEVTFEDAPPEVSIPKFTVRA